MPPKISTKKKAPQLHVLSKKKSKSSPKKRTVKPAVREPSEYTVVVKTEIETPDQVVARRLASAVSDILAQEKSEDASSPYQTIPLELRVIWASADYNVDREALSDAVDLALAATQPAEPVFPLDSTLFSVHSPLAPPFRIDQPETFWQKIKRWFGGQD